MNPKIRDIANLIRAKKEQNQKCVVLLGAGASMSSGVIATNTIMEGLLAQYGQDLKDGSLRDRFDRLWSRSDENTREMFLRPYLDLKPSSGYARLAKLLDEGYFDIVITFNFDQLLEKALNDAGCTDVLVVVRGEMHSDAAVRQSLEMIQPRIKILKMHGGLKGGDTFLFSRLEMHKYPEEIEKLLQELTRRDIIVCGYAFEDICVARAFPDEGGSIYSVNPGGPPSNLVPYLMKRHSTDWSIDQNSGRFDDFFGELYDDLESVVPPPTPPKSNPFKFLVSYDARDKDWFYGRGQLIRKTLRRLAETSARVIHLVGPSKAGKTSFVRAGLLASLDPQRYCGVYLRCQSPLETWLPQAIARVLPAAHADSLNGAVSALAASTAERVVVVLDQFERIASRYPETEAGRRQLLNCLNKLSESAPANVTFLCVGVDETNYLKTLLDSRAEYVDIPCLPPKIVGGIIGRMSRQVAIQFDPEVVRALMQRYDETAATARPFTLAHVQAVCNILAASAHIDRESYEKVVRADGEALDVALNVCDIVSFVEDIPDEIGRNLFRKVMKVIPVESKKVLANYLKDNFSDLFTPPEFQDAAGVRKAAV
jgi:hypothetical protein